MSKIRRIATREYLFNLRRRSFLFTTLLVPLVMVGIGLFTSRAADTGTGDPQQALLEAAERAVGYVDETGFFATPSGPFAAFVVPYPDEEAARRDVVAGVIRAYFLVPEDYFETGEVRGYSLQLELIGAAASPEIFQAFLLDSIVAGLDDRAVAVRATRPIDLVVIRVEPAGERSQGELETEFLPIAFALILFTSIFMASGFLLQGVAEEKQGRMIEILVSSVSSTQLLAGKILGLGLLGLTQIAFWAASARFLLGGRLLPESAMGIVGQIQISDATLALAVAYYVLGFFAYAGLMAGLGSLGSTARESQQVAAVVALVAISPIYARFIITAAPHGLIAVVISLFPLTAPVGMMIRLAISSVPPLQVAASIALLVAAIPLLIWLSARVFRASLLTYGKAPRLRQLLAALRHP